MFVRGGWFADWGRLRKYQVARMPGEITQGLGITKSIDIPAIPTTFYPGLQPLTATAAQPQATAA